MYLFMRLAFVYAFGISRKTRLQDPGKDMTPARGELRFTQNPSKGTAAFRARPHQEDRGCICLCVWHFAQDSATRPREGAHCCSHMTPARGELQFTQTPARGPLLFAQDDTKEDR
jgi:hypothetical protein